MNEPYALSAENILASLPRVLREDANMHALAASISEALARRVTEIDRVSIYAHIDELPEELLDILARDFKVDWYDFDYTMEQKRKTLKDSFLVYRHLGTKFAVTTALSAIYPINSIQEWYEYGGHPHAFRLTVDATDVPADAERRSRILTLVRFYKNLRSYLDRVEYIIRAEEDAELRLGGQVCCIAEICIPEAKDDLAFDTSLMLGGLAASVASLPLSHLPDDFSFTDDIHLGGRMAQQATLRIPGSEDTLLFSAPGYIGGRAASITTISMPVPQDADGQKEEDS